jgi:hypothetical protein
LVNAVERGWLAGAIVILVAGGFFTPQLVTSSASVEESSWVESRAVAASSDAFDAREMPEIRDERSELANGTNPPNGFMDLYGNEVSDAIATYTFDQAGSLYELHSPQTELPRLGIPKS